MRTRPAGQECMRVTRAVPHMLHGRAVHEGAAGTAPIQASSNGCATGHLAPPWPASRWSSYSTSSREPATGKVPIDIPDGLGRLPVTSPVTGNRTPVNLPGRARPETSRIQYGPFRAGPTTPLMPSRDAGRDRPLPPDSSTRGGCLACCRATAPVPRRVDRSRGHGFARHGPIHGRPLFRVPRRPVLSR